MQEQVKDCWLTEQQTAAMIAEYDRIGTCTCPRCGKQSQPWAGLWACECGAITCKK